MTDDEWDRRFDQLHATLREAMRDVQAAILRELRKLESENSQSGKVWEF